MSYLGCSVKFPVNLVFFEKTNAFSGKTHKVTPCFSKRFLSFCFLAFQLLISVRGKKMFEKLNKAFLGETVAMFKEPSIYVPDKANSEGADSKKCFFVKGIGEIEIIGDIDIEQILDESLQADISLNENNIIEEGGTETEFYIYALSRPHLASSLQ